MPKRKGPEEVDSTKRTGTKQIRPANKMFVPDNKSAAAPPPAPKRTTPRKS